MSGRRLPERGKRRQLEPGDRVMSSVTGNALTVVLVRDGQALVRDERQPLGSRFGIVPADRLVLT